MTTVPRIRAVPYAGEFHLTKSSEERLPTMQCVPIWIAVTLASWAAVGVVAAATIGYF